MVNRVEPQLDVNESTIDELGKVNKLGPVLAERIISARPFQNLDELTKVPGIGPVLLEQLRPYLTVKTQTEEAEVAVEEIEENIPVMHQPVIEPAEVPEFAADLAVEEKVKEISLEIDESVEEVAYMQEPIPDLPPEPHKTDIDAEAAKPSRQEPMVAVGKETESIFYPTEEEPKKLEAKVEAHKPPEEKHDRAIQVVEPAKEQAKKEAPGKPGVRKGEMLAWVIGGSLLSLILAVLISLGILGIANGSLRYRTERQAQREVAALQDRLDIVDSQIDDTAQDITGLRTRLDTLETLSGRISALETETADLEAGLMETTDSLNAVVDELAGINEEMDVLTEEIVEIKAATSLFGSFLQQLQGLLNNLMPAETGGTEQ